MNRRLWAPASALAALLASAPLAYAQAVTIFPNIEIHIGHTAPPPQRVEVLVPRPGRGYSWVRGGWDLRGDDWVWMDGRWLRPERPRTRWVVARYASYGGAWRYTPGHWSDQRVIAGADYRAFREARHARRHAKHHLRHPGHGHGHPGKARNHGRSGKHGR